MLEFIVFRATGQGATPMDGTTCLLLKGCCLRRLRCRTSRDASRKGTPDDWSAHLAHSLRSVTRLRREWAKCADQSSGVPFLLASRDVLHRSRRRQQPLSNRHVVPSIGVAPCPVALNTMNSSIDQSANSPQSPVRPGGEFFTSPSHPSQRRYEALRAYLHDGEPAAVVAQRFGYTPAALNSAVRDFRAGAQEFFLTARPGPKSAPGKDAARTRIIELRTEGHSIDEIAVALAAEGLGLNRTGIAEVITEQGLPRLWRRPDTARGGPRREVLPRAELLDFSQLPARSSTNMAGLLLTIPDLLALDLPALVTAAGYPGTRVIPAINYLLSLLALKLTATRRVSHVEDLAADPGAALFAGLTALPKTTALTSYSYRLQHAKQAAFLSALDRATLKAGLATGEAVNLDFHAVKHWGQDPALEKHYVPSRSQAPARS